MDNDTILKLAHETAREEELVPFALEPEGLAEAIVAAIEEHDSSKSEWDRRNLGASILPEVARLSKAVERASKMWSALPDAKRDAVLWLQDMDTTVDHIGERLQFVLDLLETFQDHHLRGKGSPGAGRKGKRLDLHPLEEFAIVIMNYWQEKTGTEFGHRVDRAHEVDDSLRTAQSPPMILLSAVATALEGAPYDIGNLETVVRRIKARDKVA